MSKPYIPKRFLGAFKAGHRHSAREFIDEELSYRLLRKVLNSNYSDSEAVSALDYLTKFNNEYHKAVLRKNDAKALHNTDELYQDRSTANNARNRDLLSVMRSSVFSLTVSAKEDMADHEEILADLIDIKNKMIQ